MEARPQIGDAISRTGDAISRLRALGRTRGRLSGRRFTFDPLEQRGGACRGAERRTERATWQSCELEVRARYDAGNDISLH